MFARAPTIGAIDEMERRITGRTSPASRKPPRPRADLSRYPARPSQGESALLPQREIPRGKMTMCRIEVSKFGSRVVSKPTVGHAEGPDPSLRPGFPAVRGLLLCTRGLAQIPK